MTTKTNPTAALDRLAGRLLDSGNPAKEALGSALDDAIDNYYYFRGDGNGTFSDIAAARATILTLARAARRL